MKNKIKRIFIGLIIPTITAVLICVAFYYKNVHEGFMNVIKDYEGDTSEQMKAVMIRKDNWQEYFTLETNLELYKNLDGELEKVQYINCLTLKDEYKAKIATERASFLNITVRQESERMKYEIVDAKAGEWKVVGKIHSDAPKGETNVKSLAWTSSYGSDFEAVYEFDSGEYMGQIFLQVPEEFEVEAVSGELYLVK